MTPHDPSGVDYGCFKMSGRYSLCSTALTVMFTVSVSLSAPPEPVLPRSFVLICRLAAPVKFAVGTKLSPFNAVLIAETVPVNVVVASFTPSPALKVNPLVVVSVIVPFVAASVDRKSVV